MPKQIKKLLTNSKTTTPEQASKALQTSVDLEELPQLEPKTDGASALEIAPPISEELPAAKFEKKGKTEPEPKKSLLEIRADRQAALFAGISKKYGAPAIALAGEAQYRPVVRYSTGILALDFSLGGGVPKGRISMFVGDYSSSKTTITLRVIADAQKRSVVNHKYLWEEMPEEDRIPVKALFIDMEGTFDLRWADTLGVDTTQLLLSRPQKLEEAGDILVTALETGAVDLVVLDSIAQLIPADEIESSMDEKSFGTAAAKKNNSMFRKVQSALNRMYAETDGKMVPTVIFTNQIRDKIGVMFGEKTTLPGGRAQEFYATCIVHCWPSSVEHFDEKERLYPKWMKFGFKVKKNKISPPRSEGHYLMALGNEPDGKFKLGDILEATAIYDWAEKTEIVKKSDKGWYMFGELFKTKKALYEEWFLKPSQLSLLRREILKTLCPKQ